HVKASWPERDLILFVDNCYGEFVEAQEPCHMGVHLVAGSLIKNPGGTIAKSGGYVAGQKRLVRAAANRMGAPGVAGGATLGQNHNLYHGLFLAPTIVGESIKGALLLAEIFGGAYGLETNPPPRSRVTESVRGRGGGGELCGRTDIVQGLRLGTHERLVRFCEIVQRNSPVNAFVRP
ncbi:unnamed protein product, partial [Choristocarpus tenellus]